VSRLLLVSEHSLVRAGMNRLIMDSGLVDSVKEAGNGTEALSLLRQHRYDVVVLDLGSEHLSVFDMTKRILASDSEARILVLTNQFNEPFPSRILQAGATACLSKRSSSNDLFSAIKAAKLGKRYISTDLAQKMVEKVTPYKGASPFMSLSNRELQIMFMFVSGMKVNGISERLCLSPKTVSTYRYRIFDKLGVRGDVEMTHMAMRYGMLREGKMSTTEHKRAS